MIWLLCFCHFCQYEFRIGFISDEQRLACPICYERFEELGREEDDDYSRFIEELGREEGDAYSRDGELPLHQMSPIPPMNDGPPPSSSSDPTVIVVPASQIAISADGLRRRNHRHDDMEDYSLVQLIPYMDNATVSSSQNDMTRCGTPAARSAVDAMPTVKITQKYLSTNPRCSICLIPLEIGGEARALPCMHMYHSYCILKWLAQNNSCPVCRHKLPAEDTYG